MSDEPWKDRARYSGKPVRCLKCRRTCPESPWGEWCYDCNVERIERINKRFEPFAKSIGEPLS